MKHEFSDGEWADVTDPLDIPEAKARELNLAYLDDGPVDPGSPETTRRFYRQIDRAIALLVNEWSLCDEDGRRLPIAPETIAELPRRYSVPLAKLGRALLNDEGIDFGPNPDRQSPTPT